MPTYSYSNANGDVVERVYPLGRQPQRIRVKGVRFVRDLAADQRQVLDTPGTDGEFALTLQRWHPSQCDEVNAKLKREGVSPEVAHCRRDGTVVCSNGRSALRQYALAMNYSHRDAGYSQVAPEDVRRYRERRGEPPR